MTTRHHRRIIGRAAALALGAAVLAGAADAEHTGGGPTGKDAETLDLFRHAGESAVFFTRCYGYAVFPTVGEGGLVVGGARGSGHVYVHDRLVGATTMTQLSVGFQLGGQAYSEIIFFETPRELEEFRSGKFEFNAGASAIAITASASASIGTDRVSSQASRSPTDATTNGDYQTGMAVFTIAKGGLMYAANIAGEKFTYRPFTAGEENER